MSSKEVFTPQDLPPFGNLDSAQTPAEYIDAFRASYETTSSPKQWVKYVDDLHSEHQTGTFALGLHNWVLQELVPRPPDAAPHCLRVVRRYERDFMPQCNIAYITLIHKHARGIRINIKTGKDADDDYSFAIDAKQRGTLTTWPSAGEIAAVYAQFDYFLKTYRLPSELAHRPSVRRLE